MASKRTTEVARIRSEIRVLQEKIEASEAMLVPMQAAIARASEMVDSWAESGAVDGRIFAETKFSPPRLDEVRDVLKFVAWIDPAAVKDRLHRTIEDYYAAYQGSLDTPETRAQIQADRDALFKLEVQEEKLIVASEDDGEPIQRRADADPRAVLSA